MPKMTRELRGKIQTAISQGIPYFVMLTEGIGLTELNSNANMIARIVGLTTVTPDGDDDIAYVDVMFDYSMFDAYNDTFAERNFYDSNSVPCLTAKEAGQWKSQETWGFGFDEEVPWMVPHADTIDRIIRQNTEAGLSVRVAELEARVAELEAKLA